MHLHVSMLPQEILFTNSRLHVTHPLHSGLWISGAAGNLDAAERKPLY